MTPISRRLSLGLFGAATLVPTVAAAAPRSRLIDGPWRQFGSSGDPDHGAWARILDRGITRGSDGIARFNYRATAKREVDAYVTAMTRVDPTTLNSSAAFAYWANLYNAITVQVVLANFPVGSIRDIGGGLFSAGPWRTKLVEVAGRPLSLDDIEHGILRPVWQDPRVHYAVNCAALGCPDLAPRPFTAARLAALLDAGARAYGIHPRGVTVSAEGLVLSSIYDWFRADFGGSAAGVVAHLRQYALPELSAALDAGAHSAASV